MLTPLTLKLLKRTCPVVFVLILLLDINNGLILTWDCYNFGNISKAASKTGTITLTGYTTIYQCIGFGKYATGGVPTQFYDWMSLNATQIRLCTLNGSSQNTHTNIMCSYIILGK